MWLFSCLAACLALPLFGYQYNDSPRISGCVQKDVLIQSRVSQLERRQTNNLFKTASLQDSDHIFACKNAADKLLGAPVLSKEFPSCCLRKARSRLRQLCHSVKCWKTYPTVCCRQKLRINILSLLNKLCGPQFGFSDKKRACRKFVRKIFISYLHDEEMHAAFHLRRRCSGNSIQRHLHALCSHKLCKYKLNAKCASAVKSALPAILRSCAEGGELFSRGSCLNNAFEELRKQAKAGKKQSFRRCGIRVERRSLKSVCDGPCKKNPRCAKCKRHIQQSVTKILRKLCTKKAQVFAKEMPAPSCVETVITRSCQLSLDKVRCKQRLKQRATRFCSHIAACLTMLRRNLGATASNRAGFSCKNLPSTSTLMRFCQRRACSQGLTGSICKRHMDSFIKDRLDDLCGKSAMEQPKPAAAAHNACVANIEGIFGALSTRSGAEHCDTQANRKLLARACDSQGCRHSSTSMACAQAILRNAINMLQGHCGLSFSNSLQSNNTSLCIAHGVKMMYRQVPASCTLDTKKVRHHLSQVCTHQECKRYQSKRCLQLVLNVIHRMLSDFCHERYSHSSESASFSSPTSDFQFSEDSPRKRASRKASTKSIPLSSPNSSVSESPSPSPSQSQSPYVYPSSSAPISPFTSSLVGDILACEDIYGATCRSSCDDGFEKFEATCARSSICCVAIENVEQGLTEDTSNKFSTCIGEGLECRPKKDKCGSEEIPGMSGCSEDSRCCETDADCEADGGICRANCDSSERAHEFPCRTGIKCCLHAVH